MKLFDKTIMQIKGLLEAEGLKKLNIEESAWPDVTDNAMILRSEMAYELGGEQLPAIGCTLVTDSKELVPEDGVFLCGDDLATIKKDVPFARIALVRVKEETLGEGNRLYTAIRNLEYTRYHFYPEGFMMRISSSRGKESVRIAKEALKKGLSFTITGNRMISRFKEQAAVEAAAIYYVTDDAFSFDELSKYAKDAENIKKTIDHISTSAAMDCHTCNLQPICDEVEGLRKLHFSED